MTFKVASIHFIQPKVTKVERVDMYAALISTGLWLVLEGFTYGYAFIEAGVNRLHILLQEEFADRMN